MFLRQKYKHLWFVFLMVFFIGGSGVAVAAVQSLQVVQTIDHTTQTMPCHDQSMQGEHHQMPMLHTDSTQQMKCHDGQMQDKQHCPDCHGLLHCQAVNLALDQQAPTLFSIPVLERSRDNHTVYQARHLAGYWQEILRPPKNSSI